MADHRETRAFASARAVARVIDAAQIDQHLEPKLGTVAQHAHHVEIAIGADDDGHLAERRGRARQCTFAEDCSERRGQLFDIAGHQRAIVFVRQILFCNCRMPYSNASDVGGHPGT